MLVIVTFFSERTKTANTTKTHPNGVNARLHPAEILEHYPPGARRGPDSEPAQIWPVFMVAASAQIRGDKRPTRRNDTTKNVYTIDVAAVHNCSNRRCSLTAKALDLLFFFTDIFKPKGQFFLYLLSHFTEQT